MDTSVGCGDDDHSASPFPAFPSARLSSECEWKPFDLVQKRSGPHNLSRSGYDEEKCRNVLVRFCAHIPRNFQYKDGIQQIFLILREHLGDENLDLAGGVLYELIELDCEHTDDPGAAFQRWRHDHMYRYADLELPHIPHMTTITSSIIPTERLSLWRSEHADRYRFVLSDSSPSTKRDYVDPSCIRNKKTWLIDHTLFVSTRSEGTRPMRSPNPKEFHEMQWDPDYGAIGRLVEEREFPITSLDQWSEASPPEAADTFMSPHSRSQRLRHSLSSISIIEKFVEKLGKHKKELEIEQRRRSWIPNSLMFDSGSLFKDKRAHCGIVSVPWPEGCQIPNAIFARKFLIVDHGETLPLHLPISQMPTAEYKATETIVEAATTGLLNQSSSWLFRGPFTPQLGFDGGLDYHWSPQDPAVTARTYDWEASLQGTPYFDSNRSPRGTRLLRNDAPLQSHQLSSKRRGRVFNLESTAEAQSRALRRDSLNNTSSSEVRKKRLEDHVPIFPPSYASNKLSKSVDETSAILKKFTLQRHEQDSQNAQLFDNIEFTTLVGSHNACSPVENRQTTVIERPSQVETVYDAITCRLGGHRQRICNSMKAQKVDLRDSQIRDNYGRNRRATQETPRELLLSNLQQGTYRFQAYDTSSRCVSDKVTGEILQPLRMDRLLRLKQADGAWNPLVFPDRKHERLMRSLRTRSEICAEENEDRVANRRFSDILPLQRRALCVFDDAEDGGVTHGGYSDHTTRRAESISLPQKVNSYLGNTTAPPHSLNKQNNSDLLGPCIVHSSSNKASSVYGFIESATPQYPNTNPIIDEAPFVMTGTSIPPSHTKLHLYGPLALHPPSITPQTPSPHFSREDSGSSLASLEARDSSIRIVKPNLTLSPLNRPKLKDDKGVTDHSTPSRGGKSQPATMHKKEQNGQKGPNKVGGSRSRSKATGEYSSSHSRSQSQNKQSFDTPEGRDPIRTSQPDAPTRDGNVQANSPDRGRTMQRRYEFIDSDDKTHATLSPVQETAKNNGDLDSKSIDHVGRESNITTMTNLLQQCVESSPPKLPVHQTRQQHQGKGGGISTSSTQPSVPQLKAKHRPPPLNLMNPAYIGMVHRHANRYQVEHHEIESSEAEHFNIRSPSAGSSVYDGVADTPRIGPLNIPMRSEINGTSSLQSYREWRENLNPVRTASQGSICIVIPTLEEDTFIIRKMMDENRLPIRDYPSVQHPPIISHVRSRSTLGIRENRDKEDRRRHFSGDSVYSDSEYSTTTPFGQGPSIGRSATMNEVPRRDRQFSHGSESKTGQNGVTVNDTVSRMGAAIPVSPFSPLTPFIMRATGAPAGTEKGSKTLFGEHGWLEDTATPGAKKAKMEKTGGFMESLKRKAREIADSTSFKPIRTIRTSAVSHVRISLDAREQSLLYCELEYNLNNALDAYFKAQLNSGRLEASKLSRVADTWAQKGRPKVIGFRYDLETQVDLITAHINDFRFYGPVQAEGPVAIAGLLHAMKTNARYMRIRTFCQPDSVIAKHVLDSQNFLRLLGSPESLQRPLEEVAQFFKVAVERRKAMTEAPAGRIISNGSGQHVRFQDDSERRRPCVEMPDASKSRSDVRDQNNRSTNAQVVKPQSEDRGLNHQG